MSAGLVPPPPQATKDIMARISEALVAKRIITPSAGGSTRACFSYGAVAVDLGGRMADAMRVLHRVHWPALMRVPLDGVDVHRRSVEGKHHPRSGPGAGA